MDKPFCLGHVTRFYSCVREKESPTVGMRECLCAHVKLCVPTKKKKAHVFLYATAGQSRAFVFSIQAKDSWACCPDLLPKSWHPPLMPRMAFVLPRNTPGTVINSSRLLIIWSAAANWTSYDRYKIRQVDIRWPILATMPRWRVLLCTVACLQNWNAVWVTDATVAQRSEKWAGYGEISGLNPWETESWLPYQLLALTVTTMVPMSKSPCSQWPWWPAAVASCCSAELNQLWKYECKAGQCWEKSLRDLADSQADFPYSDYYSLLVFF